MFDFRNVECVALPTSNGRYKVFAQSYCADPLTSASASSNKLKFYSAPTEYFSRVEAEAHVESEVRRATAVHPKTRFFREQCLRMLQDNRVLDDVFEYHEFCLAGVWQRAERPPGSRRCPSCGFETELETFCPKCAEPILEPPSSPGYA